MEGYWRADMPNGDVIINNIDGPNQPTGGYEDMGRKDWIRYEGQASHGLKHGLGILYF